MKRASVVLMTALAVLSVAGRVAAAEPAEWGPIDLRSGTIAPGTKDKFTFQTQRSFEGSFLDTSLWAARGVEAGPTLCVVSGIHALRVSQ